MAEHLSVELNRLSESVINAVKWGHFPQEIGLRSEKPSWSGLNDTVQELKNSVSKIEHPRRSETQATSDEGRRKNSSNIARNKRNRSSNLHLFCSDICTEQPRPSRTGLPSKSAGVWLDPALIASAKIAPNCNRFLTEPRHY